MQVGDPLRRRHDVGPLVAERQRDRVEGYIALGRPGGRPLVAGGGRPADLAQGWYVEPTILADVDNDMRVAREEIFGPVLALIPYDDEDEAVRIANDSDYGLSGGVYADDRELGGRSPAGCARAGRGQRLPAVPVVPFGGFKESGLGRELGPEGIAPYLETKMIQGI